MSTTTMKQVIAGNPVLSFGDVVLRGTGQVWFQNNPLTGLLLYLGIFYNSMALGVCTLLGTVVSTGTAVLLGVDKDDLDSGLYGFNGALAGVAMGFYFNMDPAHYGYLLLAAAASSLLMAALLNFFGKWGIAPLTAPFVLATWIVFFACYQFSVLSPNALIGPAALGNAEASIAVLSAVDYFNGITKGVGEVMFQDNAVTGVIFLAALLVNSRLACLWAVIGAGLGLLTAQVLGAAHGPLSIGIYGYSAVLTAIALGSGVFLKPSLQSGLYALLAIILTSVAQAAVGTLLAPVGMPPLTWPFIIITWIFLLALPKCGRVNGSE